MDLDKLERTLCYKYPAYWALKYKTIKSRPLTFISKSDPFRHRPWQEEILNDLHPNKVVQKSRQLGMSEISATEALWFADMHDNVNIMYTFPTKQQMEDFSKTRVDPVINNSKYLLSKTDKINSVSTKAIGNSYLFMRTAGDGRQGEGADIDAYFADEYDRMAEGIETSFTESLQSSKYKLIRRWSTPTIPGTKINKAYMESDQRCYLHKCDKCGKWQQITIDNIVQVRDGINPVTREIAKGTYEYLCKHCKKPLNRFNLGEWVAKRPDIKDTRGYFISQLNAVWISADDIKERENKYAFKSLFHNYVLGEPFANVAMEITDADIQRNITLPKEEQCRDRKFIGYVAGIDWGEPTWALVLGITERRTLQIVSLKQFNRSEIHPLYDVKQVISHLIPFKPNLIIADAGYGADKNTELYRAFPNSLFTCKWTTSTNPYSAKNFIDHWNMNKRLVTVDKTSKMQRTLQAVKTNQIGFYEWQDPMTQVISKHLQNVQILDKDNNGMVYQMATRKGPDHLACCLAYALIGVDQLTNYGLKVSQGYQMETIAI